MDDEVVRFFISIYNQKCNPYLWSAGLEYDGNKLNKESRSDRRLGDMSVLS